MKFISKILIIIIILIIPGSLQSQIFPPAASLTTGQGAVGSNDPIWLATDWYTVVPPNPMGLTYAPALINNPCVTNFWVNPSTLPSPLNNGNWITGSGALCSGQTGYRYFRLPLNLPADCNGNSVTTVGNYVLYLSGYVDDGIIGVYINGNSTGFSGGSYGAGAQLNMTLAGPWLIGINYVDILVYNITGVYGLFVVANSTATSIADGDGDGLSDLYDNCPCEAGALANGCKASILGNTVICHGEGTTLTATGIGSYLWNTGSTNAAINVNPALPTGYYVIVTKPNGFKDSSYVYVNPAPLISVSGDTLLCQPENTVLTATGGGTYIWNNGSTNASITVNPMISSSYEVIVTCTNGCKDTLNQAVFVYPKPVANFNFTNKCFGIPIPFNSSSTINAASILTNWAWDFGDNTTGSGSSISHLYNLAGSYNVTLIVSSNKSCSDTIVQQITVYKIPLVNYSNVDVCLGDTMFFTNSSTVGSPAAIASYLWDFDDNGAASSIQNPTYFYPNAGTYNVKLIAITGDGCSDSIISPVNSFNPPSSAFSFSNSCLYDSALFVNNSLNPPDGTIVGWSWSFGDGGAPNTTVLSPSHLYSIAGNYTVTLITLSSNIGCPDTLQKIITIHPIPVANFSFIDVCLAETVNFYDSTKVLTDNIISWTWNFGDGTAQGSTQHPNHLYVNPGTYIVSLIATSNNGCNDTVIKNVVVHPLPVALFSALNVCADVNTTFTDQSTILSTDNLQSWAWGFGDANPVGPGNLLPNTFHLYTDTGTYLVKLIVHSNFGCVDSITKPVIVYANPVSNFNNTSVCNNSNTQFTDSSSSYSGNINSWLWDFDDGVAPVNTISSPSYLYNNAGTYNVTLIVNSSVGCADTIIKAVEVYYNPVANFNHVNVCAGDTTHFLNTSSIHNSTSIASYSWMFGDGGANSILQNPARFYTIGTYSVLLLTTSAEGCFDTASSLAYVFDAPISGFLLNNSCLYDSAKFTNTAVSPSLGNIAGWSWNFGDGTPINTVALSPSHYYSTAGDYQITLVTYSSNLACSDTIIDSITIYPKPAADFDFVDVCLNQPMNFTDLSSVAGGTITSWAWDFKDNTAIGITQDPSHAYNSQGVFPVLLLVTDNNNCNDTISKNALIHPLPVVAFSASKTCLGSLAVLTDLSTISPGNNLQTWSWDFGDNSAIINNQNTSHLYSAVNSYPVELLVSSNFGCSDSITKTIVINPYPIVDFAANDSIGCELFCVGFQDASIISGGVNVKWQWDFGDGSISNNSQNLDHCYSNDSVTSANYFDVTLTVSSDSGCVSVLTKSNYITVYPNPVTEFIAQPKTTSIIDPSISVANFSTGATFWNWDFGDFTSSSLSNPEAHNYSDTGSYTITLIAFNANGCSDTSKETIIIMPEYSFYIPNSFTPNGDGKNDTFSGKGLFIKEYEMTIFNRWGSLIFKTNDIHIGWDGKTKINGELAELGVYVYDINITDINKERYNYNGTVTLVR